MANPIYMNRTLRKSVGPVALPQWQGGVVVGVVLALAGAAASIAATPAPVAPAAATAYSDLSLEQLMDLKVERVYGASRQVQKVTQAPSAVSIVTADDIRQFGWRTLADLLRSVRGFYASDDRNYTYLGTRGFQRPGDYNTRMLVLIDGHRMNDNVYDGAYVGRESMVALDAIERVEVIRGPSSSLYGSSAFFGVINLVTKREAQFSVDVGTLGSTEGRFAWHQAFRNRLEWQISGSYFASDGEQRLYFPEFDPRRSATPGAANDGIAANADREESAHLYSALSYRDLTFSAFVSRRLKDVPTASYGTLFNDGREQTVERRGYVDAKLDRAVADHRLLGRVFYDQYRYDGRYPYDYAVPGGAPDVVIERDGAIGEWIGTEWQFDTRLAAQHSLILGTEFRQSLREYQFNAVTGVPFFEDRRHSRNLGVFGQWEFTPRKEWLLSAGLRYDRYFGSFGGTLNPRLALIYNPTPASTLKLLYGDAFRAPNAYERFYYDAQQSEPMLQPERIRTQELIYEHYWGPVYRTSVSVYHYDVGALISQTVTAAGELYFQNANATHARGAEVEFEAKHPAGWLARASYAVQRALDQATDVDLSSSPRALAKLNLGWAPAARGWSVGAECQYQSRVRTLSGATSEDALVANLHLSSTRLLPSCEISLTASNLFNNRHRLPGAEDHVQDEIAQPGRILRLKITRKF